MKHVCWASLVAAALLAAGCDRNNRATARDTAGTSGRAETVSRGDRDFVQDVARMNAGEVELSRFALERSSSPDVKKFAQMMVDDHTAAAAQLSGVASQNAIDAPAQPDEGYRKTREKLAEKQGLDFDRDFMDAIVDDHGKLLDKLDSRLDRTTVERWKGTVANPAGGETAKVEMKGQTVLPDKSDDPVTQRINAWAADTYPTAYAHLQAAKALKDTLKKRSTD